MNKMRFYFDYAATTPVDERVVKAMRPYFAEKFGNTASLHYWGQEAALALGEARVKWLKFWGLIILTKLLLPVRQRKAIIWF